MQHRYGDLSVLSLLVVVVIWATSAHALCANCTTALNTTTTFSTTAATTPTAAATTTGSVHITTTQSPSSTATSTTGANFTTPVATTSTTAPTMAPTGSPPSNSTTSPPTTSDPLSTTPHATSDATTDASTTAATTATEAPTGVETSTDATAMTTTTIAVTSTTAPMSTSAASTVPTTTHTSTETPTDISASTTGPFATSTSAPTSTPVVTTDPSSSATHPSTSPENVTTPSDAASTSTIETTWAPTTTAIENSTNVTTMPPITAAPTHNCSFDIMSCVSNNTASVQAGSDGNCTCVCRNEWQGADCNQCPAQYAQPSCASCAQGRYGSTCDAASFVVATVTSGELPSTRIVQPWTSSSSSFWQVATSTSIQNYIMTSQCLTGSSSGYSLAAVVHTTLATIKPTLRLSVSLVVTITIASGNTVWTSSQIGAQHSLVVSAASCVASLLNDVSQLPSMNAGVPNTNKLPSSFFDVPPATSSANVSTSNPCGQSICVTSALAAAATYPADPAVVAAAAAATDAPSGLTAGSLGLIAAVGSLVLLGIIGFAVYMFIRRKRQSKKDSRRELGISFANAMECDSAISDMTLEQAAALLRGSPPNSIFHVLQQQREMSDL